MMSPAFGQPAQQTNDPAVPKRAPNQREGLFDFALKHINSSGRDYGQCIDEGRKILLQETIENGYFWSNLISLGLLGCFLIIIIHQHKLRGRRELIVAESFAQYQHALARADVQIHEATKRNLALMEALSSSIERGIHNDPVEQQPKNVVTVNKKEPAQNTRKPANSPAPVSVSGRPTGNSQQYPNVAGESAAVTASVTKESAPNAASPAASSLGKGNPDVDLITRINVVQQQLAGSQEREKQLRRQLNDAELRLQKEQQKNRSLKGE
jgi:hypothetical protein